MTQPMFKRILLKMGGESLAGPGGMGIQPALATGVAEKVKAVHEMGVQVAVVLGAGNWWRGKDGIANGMDRSTADHIGMLATVMNALAMRDAFERVGLQARVQTAIEIKSLAEPYIRLKAISHLESGKIVIMGAGTGNPYFTTDTAGALRAMEIGADVLIKATKVDGVYDSDPMKNPSAKKFGRLDYRDALNMGLSVMDSTALTLCQENKMPILVLNLWEEGALLRAVRGEAVGTMIS